MNVSVKRFLLSLIVGEATLAVLAWLPDHDESDMNGWALIAAILVMVAIWFVPIGRRRR